MMDPVSPDDAVTFFRHNIPRFELQYVTAPAAPLVSVCIVYYITQTVCNLIYIDIILTRVDGYSFMLQKNQGYIWQVYLAAQPK